MNATLSTLAAPSTSRKSVFTSGAPARELYPAERKVKSAGQFVAGAEDSVTIYAPKESMPDMGDFFKSKSDRKTSPEIKAMSESFRQHIQEINRQRASVAATDRQANREREQRTYGRTYTRP